VIWLESESLTAQLGTAASSPSAGLPHCQNMPDQKRLKQGAFETREPQPNMTVLQRSSIMREESLTDLQCKQSTYIHTGAQRLAYSKRLLAQMQWYEVHAQL
jgi:hypothetical protein